MAEYTLVFELNAASGWSGYIRQLPQVEKVRGYLLKEVKYQLTSQLVEMLWAMPNEKAIVITTEFYYQLPTSKEHLNYN